MPEQITESLFDVPDRTVEIETTADVIKPIAWFVKPLVDEYRIHLDSDGLYYKAVDPANVTMVELHAPKEAFDSWNVDDELIGVNVDSLMRALRPGRQRQSDTISLATNGSYLTTSINREYDGTEMQLQNKVALIDPDAIRQEPDLPDIDLEAEASISLKAFNEAVKQAKGVSDYVEMEVKNGDLLFSSSGDVNDAAATVESVASGEDCSAIFALDYLTDGILGFKKAKTEDISINFGPEFPVRIDASPELNGTEIDLTYLQAPRIQSGPEDR